ncbi:MAG: hypothetical protein QM741_15985 [Rudaea sp.]|uniref:hypothetical protein n=1 Tax=Rudaea sp. TaxID=2136325 RepID=UPI0039E3138A
MIDATGLPLLAEAKAGTDDERKLTSIVIPAKAGIQRLGFALRWPQKEKKTLDSDFRRNDEQMLSRISEVIQAVAILRSLRSGKNIAKNAGAAIR